MRAVWILGVLITAAMTGCVTEDPAPETLPTLPVKAPDVYGSVRELLGDLPCEAASVGETTSENLKQIHALEFESSGHAELDIRGDLAAVSTYGGAGFELVNISDPAKPVVLSTWSEARGTALDVKLTPDRSMVFVGVDKGIDVVDVRDVTEPKLAGRWDFPMPNPALTNAHMIYLYAMEEKLLLFIAPEDNTGVWILEVTGTADAFELKVVSQAGGNVNGPLGPHDMWATYDADLKTHVLYIANGFMGWLAYDINDPAAPKLLGGTINADTHQGYIHTIQAAKIGGRRLVAVISEVGVNAMRVYDASNLQVPVLLGSWTYTVPVLLQHNLQLVNTTLYFAHYGQGIYAFDLTKVGTTPYAQMQQLKPAAHYAVGDGSAWDVVLKDGVVWVSDSKVLHAVGYGCLTPGDATATSTG